MNRELSSLLIAVTAVSVMGFTGTVGSDPSEREDDQAARVVCDPRSMSDLFADISQKIGPSVVTITSTSTVTAQTSPLVPWGFGFGFPGQGGTREYTREGLGSGVIISEDGLIVTNNHVVGDADELKVVLSTGDEATAKLVGADPSSDLALIRIETGQALPAVSMGDSDQLRVGEWVLAIGSPFALSQTVTQGIVSYLGREGVGLADYENYIQTDAAVNPGNSGGALVNLNGELIGINTAIASRNGGYQGVGFAIPVSTVRNVVDDLLAYGEVRRGWLGVSLQEINTELAVQFNLQNERGALIADILPGSPAEESGLMRGDVVILLNGSAVDTPSSFRNRIAGLDPGSEISLRVIREGRERDVSAILSSAGEDPATVTENMETFYGWRLGELTEDLSTRLDASGISGVVVLDVYPGGPAAMAGLQPGDIITEVSRTSVATVAEVGERISEAVGEALLLVYRHGRTLFLIL